ALDDVLLSAIIHLDAGAVQANDVARSRCGAADGVEVATADLNAEQVVALRRARSGGRFGAIPDAALAIGGDADEVVLDEVPRRGRGERPDDVNAVDRVA